MRKLNPLKIHNALQGLKMSYPNEIQTSILRDRLKTMGISFTSHWQSVLIKSGVLYKTHYGYVGINPDLDKVIKACDIKSHENKISNKTQVKVKVFNKEVEHRITIEEAKLFLEKKGYFVYRPSKGDTLTIHKEIKF